MTEEEMYAVLKERAFPKRFLEKVEQAASQGDKSAAFLLADIKKSLRESGLEAVAWNLEFSAHEEWAELSRKGKA